MNRRITLRDIARRTGFHYSTVSLALRDHLSIPLATRKKIQQTARKLGYQPDPMVQALAAYRSTIRPTVAQPPLAWLTANLKSDFRKEHNYSSYAHSARQRAAELGYRLEEFSLAAPGLTPDRLGQILVARGISGILVAPQPSGKIHGEIDMDWAPFSAVAFGYTLAKPRLHIVTNHQTRSARLAVRKLAERGYRRIGLCLSRISLERVDGNWLGGYTAELDHWPELTRIEPLLVKVWSPQSLRRWYSRNKPDAILTEAPSSVRHILSSLNLKAPQDIGIACLRVAPNDPVLSGIDQNDREIGFAAVESLVNLIHTHQRGIPAIERSVLIDGTWHEGRTLRAA